MTAVAELQALALDATGRIVRGVPAEHRHAAIPCADWDARALVNHLASGDCARPNGEGCGWPCPLRALDKKAPC